MSNRLARFRSVQFLSLVVALLVMLLTARQAEARRGFLLITFGDKISEIAPIAPDVKAEMAAEFKSNDLVVAYYYQCFGIFNVDLWTWGGSYCVYDRVNMECLEMPAEIVAPLAGMSENEISVPLLYRFPPGLTAIVVLGFLWVLVACIQNFDVLREQLMPAKKKKKKKRKEPRPEEGFVTGPDLSVLPLHKGELEGVFEPEGRPKRRAARPKEPAITPTVARKPSTLNALPGDSERMASDLIRDPRYREAIKRSIQHSSQLEGVSEDGLPRKVSIKVGVDYLTGLGIDPIEAKAQLAKAVPAVLRAKRRQQTRP